MAKGKICGCGCGEMTKGGTFVPGHDAKLKSRLLSEMRAGNEAAEQELIERGWWGITGTAKAGGGFRYTLSMDLPEEAKRTEGESLVEKVAKILALQAGAKTQGEAEAAAAMAQKLAFKYNLDLDAIAKGTKGIGDRKVLKGHLTLDNSAEWLGLLLNIVARYNFCRTVLVGRFDGKYAVVGERHNLLIVDYIFAYLVFEIKRLADAGWKNLGRYGQTGYQAATWKSSFREGAIVGIQVALEAQRKADVTENVGGSALVVLKDAEVEEALNEYFPSLVYGSRRKQGKVYNSAFDHGYDAGKGIEIRRGVGHGTPQGAAAALAGGRR